MTSAAPEKKPLGTGLFDSLKGISPNYGFIDYIKRFFYQIIGIYFPASVLFLYIFLFWFVGSGEDPIAYYKDPMKVNGTWPQSLVKNISTISNIDIGNEIQVAEIILFIIAIVILGEGINAVTARVTLLSPVITTRRENVKFSVMNRPFPGISNAARWPIWLNETSFPVSFAQFDRYYVSALEQDKRTLAGKIGWVSFYRNMVAVFAVILIMQGILFFVTGFKTYGYEFYVLAVASLALVLLLFGYWAQIKSNKTVLWDAYRRYELRKNLEIRYGDLSLAFGIKDEYKTKAIEYMVDRWFLGVDNTIQTISRYFLTKVESEYLKVLECRDGMELIINENKNKEGSDKNLSLKDYQIGVDIIKVERNIKNKLTDSYSDWNRGAYERVIANALDAFKDINKFLTEYDRFAKYYRKKSLSTKTTLSTKTSSVNEEQKNHGESEQEEWKETPSEQDWKTILGFYVLENSLRTDAAYVEMITNVSNRKWTILDDKESVKNKDESITDDNNTNHSPEKKQTTDQSNVKEIIHDFYTVDEEKDKKLYDQMANLIRETSDDYQRAFLTIMDTIKIFNKLLSEHKLEQDQKEKCFSRLKRIYYLFGGYDYVNARKEAEDFFNGINQSGSTYLTLKSKGYFYRENFIGDSTNLLDKITEEATITEIKNPTPFKLSKVYHRDPNGRQAEICLESNKSQNIDQEQIMVAGEWNVESGESSLPEQLRIQIGWKAPIKKT